MAHNDATRLRIQSARVAFARTGDRVHAASWHALAHATVASALVIAIAVVAMAEAAFSDPARQLARHTPVPEWRHVDAAPAQ